MSEEDAGEERVAEEKKLGIQVGSDRRSTIGDRGGRASGRDEPREGERRSDDGGNIGGDRQWWR